MTVLTTVGLKNLVCKCFGEDVVKSVRERERRRERERERRRKKKKEKGGTHPNPPNPLAFAKMTNAGTEA